MNENKIKEYVRLAQMMQAAPRAYGERHTLELCHAVIALSDTLKDVQYKLQRELAQKEHHRDNPS